LTPCTPAALEADTAWSVDVAQSADIARSISTAQSVITAHSVGTGRPVGTDQSSGTYSDMCSPKHPDWRWIAIILSVQADRRMQLPRI
jgi:hypothetical protein